MFRNLTLTFVLALMFSAIVLAASGSMAQATYPQPNDSITTGFYNDTGETILMSVVGRYGSSPYYKLRQHEYLQLDFYPDGSDRALVVYNASMTKILFLHRFVPGPYTLLITKDKIEQKQGYEMKPEKPNHPNAGTTPF